MSADAGAIGADTRMEESASAAENALSEEEDEDCSGVGFAEHTMVAVLGLAAN